MFENYIRVPDCGNGYGYSILHDSVEDLYEIAALRNGKYWSNTKIHDELACPLRGSWELVRRTIKKIENL